MKQNNSHNRQRIASVITRNISDIILFELKKPIFKLVSVNQVDVTPDYQFAKVYVSHLDLKKINEPYEFTINGKNDFSQILMERAALYYE